ncbi:MAG: SCP2 sterol-binding domain-containing protein [Candidatus Thorarchaeota archaeon]
MISTTPDFIGTILAKLLEKQLSDPKMLAKVRCWKMIVILDTNFYSVSLIFDDGLKIQKGAVNEPTVRVFMTFDTLIDLVKATKSPIGAVLSGNLKIKGLLRHPIATYRFYKLIVSALRG